MDLGIALYMYCFGLAIIMAPYIIIILITFYSIIKDIKWKSN